MNSDFFSLHRGGAMCLRHFYVLKGSWPRLIEMAYWPTMQMVIWGFLSTFLATNSTWVAGAFGVLLSAVMLWDVLFRGQLGFSLSFLEEMWSRNLANLYCSPLTPTEHVTSLVLMALIRALIGVVPAMLLAIPFYHFSIFGLGLPLAGFFFNLLLCLFGVYTAVIFTSWINFNVNDITTGIVVYDNTSIWCRFVAVALGVSFSAVKVFRAHYHFSKLGDEEIDQYKQALDAEDRLV